MSLDKKITDFLDRQIPEYVQEFYPIFVIFVTKYYEWLEQGGNPQEIIQNIQLNADIDTTASSLATKFVNTYAPNLPQTSALDRAVLVKNFRDFYRSKGSSKSFEFFFRAFFDDDITIKLPGDSLFRTSGGDWYVEKTLRVRAITGNPKNLEHVTVQGSSSNATAIIEHAVQNYGLWDLTVQNRSLSGTFSSSETITGTYWVHTATTSISSQIVVQNTAPVNVAAGRQRGTRSQVSADQVIQDSIYWQRFSYVIKTRITLDRWKDAVLEQLHPSGRTLFGEILVESDSSVGVRATAETFAQSNAISTEVRFANSDDFIIQPGYSFDRLANFRTGTSTTTSAGAVTYAADYTYGGENITFALQNAADNIRSYVESFSYTSITGTVSAAATTGNTAINRDSVSYTMPVTSITGTISGISQPGGGEMVVTGSGTLFTTELPLDNVWRYYTGTVDAFNNPIYEYYSSVLTIGNLPITGTVTLAAQTPVAPNYYYYVTGTNTKFLSDLLITGGDTSTGISNEINAPRIFPGQPQPQVILNNVPLSGNTRFNSGEATIYDTTPNGQFLSQIYVGKDITIIKSLSNRLTQISSLPAIASTVLISASVSGLIPIGSGLTTVSSTASSRAQESSLATTTDPAMWSRWDIDVPFPIYFVGTSTTRIYIHSTGMIGFSTSVAAHGNTNTTASSVSSFQPAVPKLYHNPYWGGKLKNVYYQTFGVTPNRTFNVYYDGWYDYPYESTWAASGIDFRPTKTGPNAEYGSYPNVLTTGVGLTLSTTPTSGTLTNGYWQLTLPWTVNFFTTSFNQIFIAHNGRVSFGDWKDGSGQTITTTVTTSNGLTSAVPVLPRIEIVYMSDSQPAGVASPWFVTQNNPRYANRIYYGVSSGTTGSANRVFTIRWEGSLFPSPNDRQLAWEMSFSEDYISSVTLSGAISAYQQQFNLASYNRINVPLWKIGLDGLPYLESTVKTASPANSSAGYYIQSYSDTSQLIYVHTAKGLITRYAGNIQRWEAIFSENSSNGIHILETERDYSTFTAQYYPVEEPKIVPSGSTYYTYFTDSDINLIYGNTTTPYRYDKNYVRYNQQAIAATSAIVSTLTLSSSTSMLFRMANNFGAANTRDSYFLTNTMYWSALGTYVGATTALQVTSMGVVSRWPQDGYAATVGNVKLNPTCVLFASSVLAITSAIKTYSPDTTSWGVNGFLSLSSTTITRYGYLFSYGSSISTHNRWLMTVPTYGTLHSIRVNGYINGTSNAGLAALSSGQNLELWYSLDENPQPPAPGITPASAGWVKLSNIWVAGTTPAGTADGIMYLPSTVNDATWATKNMFTSGSSYNGSNGIYAFGKAGYYGGGVGWTPINSNYNTAFKLTWLIYQANYTAQTTADQRTSEYLLTDVTTRSYPSGYINTFINNAIVSYDTNLSNSGITPLNSANLIRLRDEIFSGSIVRIPFPSDRLGGTTSIDCLVTQDPALRTVQGDYTLIVVPISSVSNLGFSNIYDGTTPGGYFKGTAAVQASIVETRTITGISSNVIATVNAPFTSTARRYWGNNIDTSATSARAFNLAQVYDNLSMALQATAGDSSAIISAAASNITVSADRRFVITGINTSSNMTISGGGVYANFTGKTATFPRREHGQVAGFLISGYHDFSLLTSDTTWFRNGIPGIDNLGVLKGNVPGTRLVIGTSSFSVVSVYNDTTILVTGSLITKNFYDTGLTMYFPSYTSNISVTGISTKFLPQITTGTATSAGVTIEEVTESGRTSDFRYGFLQIGNTSFTITSIVNDTSLIVAGGPITEPFASSTAISYVYRRDYPLPRVIGAPDSASFDKAGSTIGVDDSLVTQGNSVDFTTFRTLYHSSSYTLTLAANDIVVSTSITVTSGSSVVLLVTWMKDFINNAAEGNNRFTVSVSSAGTFRVVYDNEIQQNFKDVAIGQTLLYSNTFYVHSSNTISSTNVVNSGDTTSQVVWTWIPYNVNRSGVYDRLSARFESRADSSINISVSVPAGYQWNSTTSDFVNITVLGAA